jgi:rod shape-determining protein MreC
MAKYRSDSDEFTGPWRLVLVVLLLVSLLGLFFLWRIDNTRIERVRMALIDRIAPAVEWAALPLTWADNVLEDFQSYSRLYAQNQQLREELRQMKAWKEAALQLEQKNARLLDLNKVRLDPRLTHLTGIVMADSGSPFRQSVLINAGARDGVMDGWAAMDGLGLVGRISGVGQKTSRVILLTDTNSRVPVVVQPSGQTAILSGDNTPLPPLDFVDDPDALRAGDLVFSSADGGIFPAGLVVGKVVVQSDKRLRVRLEADFNRLEYLRIMRSQPMEVIPDAGSLIVPKLPIQGPPAP